MNNDPYRGAPQPADRRVINRSGAASPSSPAYRAADEPQSAKDEASAPTSSPRSSHSRRAERDDSRPKSHKGLLWTLIIILVIAVIGAIGWFVWSNAKTSATGIDTNKYQAVFLSNGQIYFGKLESFDSEYFRLTTGYSAQTATTADDAETTSGSAAANNSDVQLIRLGDEVYGPENAIFITKQQVLHFENLKDDSKVTQLIDQNEAGKK